MEDKKLKAFQKKIRYWVNQAAQCAAFGSEESLHRIWRRAEREITRKNLERAIRNNS